ncbi:hypothetical protein BC834DRAFT_585821 [Gloeopeniophorella convolvens]|nr:hypothetical protein BC834DRAFT_585821 [Gloeopeniophorella convolvens]
MSQVPSTRNCGSRSVSFDDTRLRNSAGSGDRTTSSGRPEFRDGIQRVRSTRPAAAPVYAVSPGSSLQFYHMALEKKPFQFCFSENVSRISEYTAQDDARRMYTRVYFASGGRILLREDQLIPALYFYYGHDTISISSTGSGKTMQIVVAALMNPTDILLVLSPFSWLQDAMARAVLSSVFSLSSRNTRKSMRYNTTL